MGYVGYSGSYKEGGQSSAFERTEKEEGKNRSHRPLQAVETWRTTQRPCVHQPTVFTVLFLYDFICYMYSVGIYSTLCIFNTHTPYIVLYIHVISSRYTILDGWHHQTMYICTFMSTNVIPRFDAGSLKLNFGYLWYLSVRDLSLKTDDHGMWRDHTMCMWYFPRSSDKPACRN